MGERSEVAQKIVEIIADRMEKPAEDIQLEMSFVNDLGADSLETVEIIMRIEDEFGLEIPESDSESIETIADAVKYVEAKLFEGQSPRQEESPQRAPSVSDPLGHLSDDQKRTMLDLGRGYLLFALQSRKTGARSMDLSSDSPAKQLVADLTDEQLEWLVDVANIEQEATNVGNSGDHSKAIDLLERVVEKAPWNSIALMSLGVQHAFQGNGKKAIELLEQAARIDPSNSQIRGNLEAVRRDFG